MFSNIFCLNKSQKENKITPHSPKNMLNISKKVTTFYLL